MRAVRSEFSRVCIAATPGNAERASDEGFCRLFAIISEVSSKEFRVRELNTCKPENGTEEAYLFAFEPFSPIWLPPIAVAALGDRALNGADNFRDYELRRALRESGGKPPSLDLQVGPQFCQGP